MVHDRFTVEVADIDTLKAAINTPQRGIGLRRLPRDARLLTPERPGADQGLPGTLAPRGVARSRRPGGGHPGAVRRDRPHRHGGPAGSRHPPAGGAPGPHRRLRRGGAAAAHRRPPGPPRPLIGRPRHPAPAARRRGGGRERPRARRPRRAASGTSSSATTTAPPRRTRARPAAATQQTRAAPAAPPPDQAAVPDEVPTIDKSAHTVAVFNASGIDGVAGDIVAPALENEGYQVPLVANPPDGTRTGRSRS